MLCTKCNIDKPCDSFRFRKDRKAYIQPCYECEKEQANIRGKKYYSEHKKERLSIAKKYYYDNYDARKEYRDGRKIEKAKYWNKYRKHRYASDPIYRMVHGVRGRISSAIKLNGKRTNKSAHTRELLGCSFEELKLYLEKQFKDNMSWSNYGFGNDRWNIDHIIPIDTFELSDPVEQKQAFHYTNLQPLWQPDNFKKHNKVNII